jgi:hypothetical protein
MEQLKIGHRIMNNGGVGRKAGLYEREHGDPSLEAALGKGLRAPHRLKALPNKS